ncbi:MAG: hypothetical protein KDJ90_15695 [Nitratireductor sp.]|nr:hypothetical protein [Nitratireductor sp.]
MHPLDRKSFLFAALAGVLLFPIAPAQAASTQWEDLGGGKARLIASLDPATNEVSGVVEFVLDDGWKTYWREPGASGIPPQFDFSGSRHFAAGEVRLPVPEHVVLPESEFVGYHGRVLFSFGGLFTSMDSGGATDGLIHVSLLAGVCEEICIPATAEFELGIRALMVSDPVAEQVTADARQALPKAPSQDFRVETAIVDGDGLEIAANVPDTAGTAELFVEGPPSWQLLPARQVARDGGKVSFRLDLSRLPQDARPEAAELRFTLTSNGKGIEQRLTPAH